MKQIPLTQGKYALVDDEDFEYLNQWKWYYWKGKNNNTGYALRNAGRHEKRNKKIIRMHREVMRLTDNDEMEIDHSNHDGLDNTKANLRVCTHQQNMMNRTSINGGSSKYLGVYLQTQKYKNREYKSWLAKIQLDGKAMRVGSFKHELEAALAYNTKAKELFGEYARLNTI